mmetsp:Transcript_6770/g.17261  ORF Transcript_6770/g.17261 Transcript_6770/m.17261 type:complete len:248 (-) Transcript_6770:3412-4155(-)
MAVVHASPIIRFIVDTQHITTRLIGECVLKFAIPIPTLCSWANIDGNIDYVVLVFAARVHARAIGCFLHYLLFWEPPASLRVQRVDARERHGQQRPDLQTCQPHPDPPDVQLRVDAAPRARARRVQLEGLVRPGAEARRRADLALGVRRRHDGARAGDVAREEQRHDARLERHLEDDRREADDVLRQLLLVDDEPDDEPHAEAHEGEGREVQLEVRPPGALLARARPLGLQVAADRERDGPERQREG